jgi:ribosomal protein S18 acetylase RimI-like enzyme
LTPVGDLGKRLVNVHVPHGAMREVRPGSPDRPGFGIRRLRESDLSAVRELRLAALSTDPLAFGSTFVRESAFDLSIWKDRIRRAATAEREATWVAELERGDLVGMIGVFPKESEFHVYGMWVSPRYRRHGIAAQLLDTLLSWTHEVDPSAEVVLSVNPTQVAAVRLYLGRGFKPSGLVEPLGHTPGAVVHEMRRGPSSGSGMEARP